MMDFGPQGLLETCDRLRAAGIPFVGAGHNKEEALAPLVLTVRGARVGILAFCDVVQISPLYARERSPGNEQYYRPYRGPTCI